MFQFYLLTVATNILAGLALANEYLRQRFTKYADLTVFMSNSIYRLVLGGITFVVGLISLFQIYPGNKPIIGDLLPSLSGLAAGAILVLAILNQRKGRGKGAEKAAEIAQKVESLASPYTTILGFAALILGVLHALFGPSAILF